MQRKGLFLYDQTWRVLYDGYGRRWKFFIHTSSNNLCAARRSVNCHLLAVYVLTMISIDANDFDIYTGLPDLQNLRSLLPLFSLTR